MDVNIWDVGGGIPRRLATHAADDSLPSWSRDGRSIYFCSNRSGSFEIYRMPSTGGNAVRITSNGGTFSAESTDRQHLYFSKTFPSFTDPRPGVWRMPVAGGQEELIIEDANRALWQVMDDGIYYVAFQSPTMRFFDFATRESRTLLDLEDVADVQGSPLDQVGAAQVAVAIALTLPAEQSHPVKMVQQRKRILASCVQQVLEANAFQLSLFLYFPNK